MKENESQQPSARSINYLWNCDFYEIKNWTLHIDRQSPFAKEFNDCFCAVYVHRGTLTKDLYQLTTGNITLEQPNFEYQLLPSNGSCTIVNFTDTFYAQVREEFQIDRLFKKKGKDILSVQTRASPASELVLRRLLNSIRHNDRVQMDVLVLDFLNEVLKRTMTRSPNAVGLESENKRHQEAVENAKEYLHANFQRCISLTELSRHCGVSLFYLSRLFKRYTDYSPHQYLLNVRLKHGELLLKETSSSIADITYASGFTSPEYFSTLFKQKYHASPTSYRLSK
ncbi:MAG TPA: AraC family transcriptional regulator [Chryseolinea sp.]